MARIESEDKVGIEYGRGNSTMVSNSIRVIGDWLEIVSIGVGHRRAYDGIERTFAAVIHTSSQRGIFSSKSN